MPNKILKEIYTKINNEWIKIDNTPPIASSSTLGGIKIGEGLEIDSTTGILSAIQQHKETSQKQAESISSSGTITINLNSDISIYPITPTGNVTFVFNSSSAGYVTNEVYTFEMIITMGSTVRTLTFPSTVTWLDTPNFATANKKYIVAFRTYDCGSTWVGSLEGKF